MKNNNAQHSLPRSLSLIGLLAFGFNIMIGSGIFFLPGEAMKIMGPAALIAIIAAFLLAGLIALCLAELSSQFDGTGGPILYARETMGSAVGFGVGWLGYLSRVASNAGLAVVFASATVSVIPALEGYESLIVPSFLFALLLLNLGKLTFNSKVMDVVLVLKVLPLFAFILWAAFHVEPEHFIPFAPHGLTPLADTILVVFYAVVGFEMLTVIAGETKDSRTAIPRALLVVVGSSALIMLALVAMLIGTYPAAANSANPVADAAVAIMGPAGGIISVGILLSVIGVNLSCAFATPRYLFALSEDGSLPRTFAAVSTKSRVPYISVWISFAIIYLLTIGNSFVALAVLAVVSRLCQYIVSCIALILMRRKSADRKIPFRVPGGSLIAIAALLACCWLLTQAEMRQLMWTAIALTLGYALYFGNRFLSR